MHILLILWAIFASKFGKCGTVYEVTVPHAVIDTVTVSSKQANSYSRNDLYEKWYNSTISVYTRLRQDIKDLNNTVSTWKKRVWELEKDVKVCDSLRI